jgi:DNA polymerase-4
LNPLWFHVDLDAFFATVELLDDPGLLGKPVIVGARPGGRGVVSTCSYEARAFGVHSAMPIGEAYRRCPGGVFLPVRMERYCELSRQVMDILRELGPEVIPVSIDEAWLDMSGTGLLYGSPLEAAKLLKRRIREETGLGISVGVATNRLVSKIASGLRKPDGLVIVESGQEAAFMQGLPLAKLWGAGEKTQTRLRESGILSMADLVAADQPALSRIFGEAGARFLHSAARGIDPGIHGERSGSRGMSTETTFERDIADGEALDAALLEMACALLSRLHGEGLVSRTLVLKLRLSDFSTSSRRITHRSEFIDSTEVLAEARCLLARLWNGSSPVRLVGLGFDGVAEPTKGGQGELFAKDDRKGRLEQVIFGLEAEGLVKGQAAPRPARLIGRNLRGRSPGGNPFHPDDRAQ